MDNQIIEWQLPIQDDSLCYNEYPIHINSKIHCFVNSISLCKKYGLCSGQFKTTDFGEKDIDTHPEYFCKKCVKKFKKMKESEGRQ